MKKFALLLAFLIMAVPAHAEAIRKVVTTGGTEVQLVTAQTLFKSVTICSESDNTGIIAVGDVDVVAAAGTQKGAILTTGGNCISIDATPSTYSLNQIYIDATVNGDGVTAYYIN